MPRRKSSSSPLIARERRLSQIQSANSGGRVLTEPRDEEVENLLVLHRVAVRRICHADIDASLTNSVAGFASTDALARQGKRGVAISEYASAQNAKLCAAIVIEGVERLVVESLQ